MFVAFYKGLSVPFLPKEDKPGNKSIITRLFEIPPERGGYDPDGSRNLARTSPPALVQVAGSYGISVDAHSSWTLDELVEALLAGKPVLVSNRVDLSPGELSHYFVVVGVVGNKVYYNDPLASTEAEGKKRQGDLKDFMKAWYSNIDKGLDPTQDDIGRPGWNGWGMVAQ